MRPVVEHNLMYYRRNSAMVPFFIFPVIRKRASFFKGAFFCLPFAKQGKQIHIVHHSDI